MSKLKRTTSIILIALFTLALLQIWPTSYALAKRQKAQAKPKIQLITPPKTQYTVGERISLQVKAPNYRGRVEYRVMLWDGNKKAQKELWAGIPGYYYKNWRPTGPTTFTIGWAITEPGPYSLTICVRRVGAKVSYDSYVKTKTIFVKEKNQESNGLVLEKQGQIYGPESIADMENIEKDIYIKGDNITLRNVMVNGTVFVDPGKDGKALIENATASKIKILSGGEKSIHLINTHTKALDISTAKKVRVELTEGSKMENTTLNSSAILELKDGAFGKIVISKGQTEKCEVMLLGKFKEVIRVEGEAAIVTGDNTEIEKVEIAPENKNSSILLKGAFNTVFVEKESVIEVDGTIKNLDVKKKVSIKTTDNTCIDVLNRNGNEVKLEGSGKIIKDEATNSGSTSGGTGGNAGGSTGGDAVIPAGSAPEMEYAGVLLSNGKTMAAAKTGNTNEYFLDLSGIEGGIGVKTVFAADNECQLTVNGYSFNLKAHERKNFGPADFGEEDNDPPGVSLSNFRENYADSKGCVSQSIILKDSSNQSATFTFTLKVK